MTPTSRIGFPLAAVLLLLPVQAAADIERRLERTFPAAAGSVVAVEISGGPISVETGPGRDVRVTVVQNVDVDTEREADEQLAAWEIAATEQGGTISVSARNRDNRGWSRRNRVRISARIVAPPDVRLDLNTSGGPIRVGGARTADVRANTSGGPIDVDGGRAAMRLETSGGPIQVARVETSLIADTSGGSITVGHVAASARDVSLETSGGGIRVGIDPAAKLDISASTSGGSVNVDGLTLQASNVRRSRINGTLNGGGGRLSAHTSGGGITLRAIK